MFVFSYVHITQISSGSRVGWNKTQHNYIFHVVCTTVQETTGQTQEGHELNSPVVIHVLPEEGDGCLRTVLLNKRHVEIVHKVYQSLRTGRTVCFATPL